MEYDDSSEFQFLFDTAGGTPVLDHNVGILQERHNRNLSQIEMIILSHGHWDHSASVLKVLEMTGKPVPVLCHPDALLHKVFTSEDGKLHEIGIQKYFKESELETKTEVILTKEPYEVTDGIMTTGEVARTNAFENLTGILQKIMTMKDGKENPDEIADDLSVSFQLKDGSVVILTGCCHSGVVNTVEQVVRLTGSSSIVGIVGGLHLHDASKERLTKTTEYLKQYPLTTVGACHCTGLKGRAALMYAFEEPFKDVGAGSVLKFQST